MDFLSFFPDCFHVMMAYLRAGGLPGYKALSFSLIDVLSLLALAGLGKATRGGV
jgi:hypothetical protein